MLPEHQPLDGSGSLAMHRSGLPSASHCGHSCRHENDERGGATKNASAHRTCLLGSGPALWPPGFLGWVLAGSFVRSGKLAVTGCCHNRCRARPRPARTRALSCRCGALTCRQAAVKCRMGTCVPHHGQIVTGGPWDGAVRLCRAPTRLAWGFARHPERRCEE